VEHKIEVNACSRVVLEKPIVDVIKKNIFASFGNTFTRLWTLS
jgi:hypothetical protein